MKNHSYSCVNNVIEYCFVRSGHFNKRFGHVFTEKDEQSEPFVFINFDSPNTPVHNFDVLDYKIYVDIRSCFISPYPKSFNGNVTVRFRVDSALSSIILNAVNTSLTINSVSLSESVLRIHQIY